MGVLETGGVSVLSHIPTVAQQVIKTSVLLTALGKIIVAAKRSLKLHYHPFRRPD